MNPGAALPRSDAGAASGSGSKRMFARHFGEMVLAMLLGMGVLSGLAALVFAAAGGSLSDQSGGFRVMLMGFNMTLPMVAWMAYRGHAAARNVEMAASMIVPTLIAAVLSWPGVLGAGAALALQHGVMIPAMLAVMLWRYEEYSHAHPRTARVRTIKHWPQVRALRAPGLGLTSPRPPECIRRSIST